MARPQLSIAQLMTATASTAIGLGLIQIDRTEGAFYRFWHEYIIGVVPLGCLLFYGLVTALIDLATTGKSSRFVVGFEVAGWLSLLIYASYLGGNYDFSYRTMSKLRPLTDYCFPNGCAYADMPVMSLHMTILFLPQFLFALVGGCVSSGLRIRLVRETEPLDRA